MKVMITPTRVKIESLIKIVIGGSFGRSGDEAATVGANQAHQHMSRVSPAQKLQSSSLKESQSRSAGIHKKG